MVSDAPFDGLAVAYDRSRPRYPQELLTRLVARLPTPGHAPTVIDAGAGTGIALEGLLPLLPRGASVHAVDLSPDMVDVGLRKFPSVQWTVGAAETYLPTLSDVDLVVAAQAYQWMDRPVFLAAAVGCLRAGGICGILENNRDHSSGFTGAYELLLERYSPGYSRHYRAFDIPAELAQAFPDVRSSEVPWQRSMSIEDVLTMSRSSTQAQRAIGATEGRFLDELRTTCEQFADDGGIVTLDYRSHLHVGATAV